MTCLLCSLETTDAKAPICKNGPCQICTTLTQVDEEINQAVANFRRLLSSRYDILSEHNLVHGLIHRLPVELKNRIFELLLPAKSPYKRDGIDGMHSFLSSISVCKKGWRDIALSNPFLWCFIHIDLRTLNSSSYINDRILRSQTLPLTLQVQVDDDTNEPGPLDVLSRCSDRLQHLSFDVPSSVLVGLQHDNFQYHRLTHLQITNDQMHHQFDQPLSLLNSTASPKTIKLDGVSIRSLKISWSRLVSAVVIGFDLENLTQLLQQAPQMTFCQLHCLRHDRNFSMPPTIHHSLTTLNLNLFGGMASGFLSSLTLPSLQEVRISENIYLTQLPALVRRSSCPLTRVTLYLIECGFSFDDLQPIPGVADLLVELWSPEGGAMMRLLLEGYFPDLRHLTLHIQPFDVLWEMGAIPLLLDRKRPRTDGPNEGRLNKFMVVNRGPALGHMWDSDAGEKLKELGATLTEDELEFYSLNFV